MSVTSAQLQDFSRIILNHDALSEVKERINKRLFDRFMQSTNDERAIIGDILANQNLFYKELDIILAEAKDLETD